MMLHSKKGIGLLLFTGLGLLIASIILIVATPEVDFREPLGMKQYNLLLTNEQLELANIYLDQALPHAATRGIHKLFRTSGLYAEETENKLSFYSPCGTHIYPLYTSPHRICAPDFRNNYKAYVRQDVDRFIDSYQDVSLSFPYFLEVESMGVQTTLRGLSLQAQPLALASKVEFAKEQTKIYPRGVFGGFTNEIQIACGTGECFAQTAQYFHDLYSLAGYQFPYVQGGESPYTYEDSFQDQQQNEESIFENVLLTRLEEGKNKFTQPGFDSSGWLWWVGWHAGVPQLQERRNAQEYYELFLEKDFLCSSQEQESLCTREFILTQAEPGDLLFVSEDDQSITHVMIYLGNGKVSHSRGSLGLVQEDLPVEYVATGTTRVSGVLRLNFAPNGREQLTTSPIEKGTFSNSCVLAIDFSQINQEAIRSQRVSLDTLYDKLEKHNRLGAVEAASKEFPRVPKELIIAIMRTEIGNVDDYLSGSTGASSLGMAGPMQVSPDTCNYIQDQYAACNYEEVIAGDVDQGILAGAATLDNIISQSKYIDDQRPNYYFVALEYNAGRGSLNSILETTSERLKIPINQLQWRDVTFEDVRDGMKKLGLSWANEPSKWKEIFEYPNLVATGLAYQCEGNLLAQYQTTASNIFFQPTFSTEVDLDFLALDLVTKFLEDLTSTCSNNLDSCVDERIQWFNEQNGALVLLSREGEQDSVAYNVLDQALNCYANNQANCVCPLDVDTSSFPPDFESLTMEFFQSGIVTVQSFDEAEERKLLQLPFPANFVRTNEPIEVSDDSQVVLEVTKNTVELTQADTRWGVGEEIDQLAFGKNFAVSQESFQANNNQVRLVDYSKEYLGTAYHSKQLGDGELRDCRASEANAGECKTQCGSFVSSAYLYGLNLAAPLVPRGNGNEKCNAPSMIPVPSRDWLQPGDVFSSTGVSAAGQKYGHTGIYVGKGHLSNPVVKYNHFTEKDEEFCYLEFTDDPKGEDIFIHSVGPVCYNTLDQLTGILEEGNQGRQILAYCRHQLLDGIDADEFEHTEQDIPVNTVAPMEWIPYTQEHAGFECRQNKHFFRFQASFAFTDENFGFSVWLNDTVAPAPVDSSLSNNRVCGIRDVGIISWRISKTQESVFSFALDMRNETTSQDTIIINESSHELTTVSDPSDLTKIYQLYKKEHPQYDEYFYLISRFDTKPLNQGTDYFYRIGSTDHYLNTRESTDEFILSIPSRVVEENILDLFGLDDVVDLVGQSLGSYLGECEDVSGRDFGFIEGAVEGFT